MNNLIDIYDGIFKYNNTKIMLLIDKQNSIYFFGKYVCEILEYKNPYDALSRHVDTDDVFRYKHIKKKLIYPPKEKIDYLSDTYKLQDEVIFVNESGLYSLILNSKKKVAKKFKKWITSDVIPRIREHGFYKLNSLEKDNTVKLRTEIAKLKDNVEKKNIIIDKLKNNQTKYKYKKGNVIYVIEDISDTGKKYKIGFTSDLSKRIYNLNTSSGDKVKLVFYSHVNNSDSVEKCVKGLMKNLIYYKGKEFYASDINTIIDAIDKCNKFINKNIYICNHCNKKTNDIKKLKRHITHVNTQ